MRAFVLITQLLPLLVGPPNAASTILLAQPAPPEIAQNDHFYVRIVVPREGSKKIVAIQSTHKYLASLVEYVEWTSPQIDSNVTVNVTGTTTKTVTAEWKASAGAVLDAAKDAYALKFKAIGETTDPIAFPLNSFTVTYEGGETEQFAVNPPDTFEGSSVTNKHKFTIKKLVHWKFELQLEAAPTP